MTSAPSRVMVLAVGLAVLMHLLLFAAIRPKTGVELGGLLVPPTTSYLVLRSSNFPMTDSEVRTIKSPVLFSLPSYRGFSRELLEQDVSTRLTFSQEVETEQFLQVDPVQHGDQATVDLNDLMFTRNSDSAPALPIEIFEPPQKGQAGRRANLSHELKERLLGGIILPVALNQSTSGPWEIRAFVNVSELGVVDHVFLDEPLESAPLNQQLLQLLYGLRFKPGEKIEGYIEIYSPESALTGERAR